MPTTYEIIDKCTGEVVIAGVEDEQVALNEIRRLSAEAVVVERIHNGEPIYASAHRGLPREYDIIVDHSESEPDPATDWIPEDLAESIRNARKQRELVKTAGEEKEVTSADDG